MPAVDKPLTKETIKESIQNLANEKLKTSLGALNRSVNGEVELFKKAVEDWFNLSMQRVSGWYKRHAQTWLITLAFILAIVCNVDSIRIIQELSNSPNLARAIAAQAESYVKTNAPLLTENGQAELKVLKEKKQQEADAALATANKLLESATAKKVETEINDAKQKVENAKLQVDVASRWDPLVSLSPEAHAAARQRKDEKIEKAKKEESRLRNELKLLKDQAPPADVAAQQARATEIEKLETQVAAAEKEVDIAVGWDATLAQFHNDLKALSATGIPMGWDEKTKRLFNILKVQPEVKKPVTPEEIAEAAKLKEKAAKDEEAKPWYQRGYERTKTWIWQPITWLETNIHRPKDWNWSVLFPALCGWALTALAASLGAPFWFDILQRIMNIRANGRAPDEKDLGTKKADPVEVKTSTPGQPTSTTTISAGTAPTMEVEATLPAR